MHLLCYSDFNFVFLSSKVIAYYRLLSELSPYNKYIIIPFIMDTVYAHGKDTVQWHQTDRQNILIL
jgi:hypothetical protein